jgi:hypothetical protein
MTDADENTKKLLCYIRDLCPEALDNVEILKFFQLLLAAHWETGSNHGKYESYLTCAGKQNLVTTTLEDNPTTGKSAPKIKITLGDVQFNKTHLGDANAESADGNEVTYSWNCATTIIFNHLFETPGQTLVAATSSFEFLTAIANEVREMLGLVHFQPVSMGLPKKEKINAAENFNLDIIFNISYNYYVSANLETHRIKVIESNISIN